MGLFSARRLHLEVDLFKVIVAIFHILAFTLLFLEWHRGSFSEKFCLAPRTNYTILYSFSIVS